MHVTAEWGFSGVGGPSGQIEYSVNIQEATTYIDIIYHGTDVWVGMAFGGLTMRDTYSMIFGTPSEKSNTPTMMDYWLVGHDKGLKKNECAGSCSQLISYSMANGVTIINASLDNDAGSVYTYNFDPTGATPVELMSAWGKEKLFYAGEHCGGCWGTGTFTYSTNSDTAVKILSKTQLGPSPVSLALFLRKNDSLMDLTIYGPTDRWFGIGWGSHSSGDSLIYDSTGTYDYYLGGQNANNIVKDTTNNFNVLSDSVIASERVVRVTRTFDTGDSLHDLIFDMTLDTVTFLVAMGQSAEYAVSYHGRSNRWSIVVTYDGSNVTLPETTTTTSTIRPTVVIDPNATTKIFPRMEIGYNSGIDIAIKLDKATEIFEVELYGPIGAWYGVLFSSHDGGDAFLYTTGYDGVHIAGETPDYSVQGIMASDITNDFTQNWNVTEISQVGGKQKIVGWRKFNTGDIANDYIINYDVNTLVLYVAHSSADTLQFDYHGMDSRWKVTIDLESGGSVDPKTTTSATTTFGNDIGDSDIKTFPITEVGDGSGIFISVTMTKSTEIYEIELHGPMDTWFGVIWADHYAGDAFIYVGDGANPDYKCSGKTVSTIHQDTIQSWSVTQNILVDGRRQIKANRLFDTGDKEHDYPFDFNQNAIKLLVAHGVGNNFDYHASNRWEVTINMESGGLSENIIQSFYLLNHAIFMFVGFAVLIPFAIFLLQFKLVFFRYFQSFWIIPIVRSCFILGTILVWMGFIEKFAHNVAQNGFNLALSSVHSYFGLILISFWTLIIVIKHILYKTDKEKEFILFNVITCILIVALIFAQIFVGFVRFQVKSVYFIMFASYCGVYFIMYLLLEIYQRKQTETLSAQTNKAFDLQLIDIYPANNDRVSIVHNNITTIQSQRQSIVLSDEEDQDLNEIEMNVKSNNYSIENQGDAENNVETDKIVANDNDSDYEYYYEDV